MMEDMVPPAAETPGQGERERDRCKTTLMVMRAMMRVMKIVM